MTCFYDKSDVFKSDLTCKSVAFFFSNVFFCFDYEALTLKKIQENERRLWVFPTFDYWL